MHDGRQRKRFRSVKRSGDFCGVSHLEAVFQRMARVRAEREPLEPSLLRPEDGQAVEMLFSGQCILSRGAELERGLRKGLILLTASASGVKLLPFS
jgi:hypothetical protein